VDLIIQTQFYHKILVIIWHLEVDYKKKEKPG